MSIDTLTVQAAADPGARLAVRASMPRPASAAAAEDSAPTRERVEQARAAANAALGRTSSELTFEFDDDIAKVVVKLIDKGTGEVIRQFPSEEMLRIARALSKEQHVGALLRADA